MDTNTKSGNTGNVNLNEQLFQKVEKEIRAVLDKHGFQVQEVAPYMRLDENWQSGQGRGGERPTLEWAFTTRIPQNLIGSGQQTQSR